MFTELAAVAVLAVIGWYFWPQIKASVAGWIK